MDEAWVVWGEGEPQMGMAADRVVGLCIQNAEVLREDILLMEAGTLKLTALGSDATPEQIARLQGILMRLQEIIDACGCHCH